MMHWHAFHSHYIRRLLLLICLFLSACGGSSGGTPSATTTAASSSTPTSPTDGIAGNPPVVNADIKILMMGNSHTVQSQLPARLEAMMRLGHPGKTVSVVVAPASLFLDEHLQHAPTLVLLKEQSWSYVILQAQKYSSSGQFKYSTSEAIALVGLARKSNAIPVLYPEWPRKGIAETSRILEQHIAIANAAPACIAPIGQAWDIALQRQAALPLYSDDGNHADPAGAHLTALVLYATLSGKSPSALPAISPSDISAAVQQQLRLAAEDAVQANSPRKYCPLDKLIF